MAEAGVIPELKRVLGAMVFAANRSLSVKEMRAYLTAGGETQGEESTAYAAATARDIEAALAELQTSVEEMGVGFVLREVAGGYRLQTDAACGKWLKQMLNMGKPNRLSLPALETLAIIAYRQPISRGQIESIRGVNVDHVVKTLMEMQLVKIVGRSELPGRPFLYGTTHTFLEHFGLSGLSDLGDMAPMLAEAGETKRATPESEKPTAPAPEDREEPADTDEYDEDDAEEDDAEDEE